MHDSSSENPDLTRADSGDAAPTEPPSPPRYAPPPPDAPQPEGAPPTAQQPQVASQSSDAAPRQPSFPRYAPPPPPPTLSHPPAPPQTANASADPAPHAPGQPPAESSDAPSARSDAAAADDAPNRDAAFVTGTTSEPTLDSVSMLRAVDQPEAVEVVGPKSARDDHVASPSDPRSAPIVTPEMYHEADDAEVPENTDDATLVQARKHRPSRWSMVGADGTVLLHTRNVIGRRPTLPRGYDAQLISLENSTKTISKTHARVEVEGSTLWLTDMGSTNGTFLSFESDSGPAYQECEPGDDYEVRVGDTITFGDYEVTVTFDDPAEADGATEPDTAADADGTVGDS